jgi:hypothetical protein
LDHNWRLLCFENNFLLLLQSNSVMRVINISHQTTTAISAGCNREKLQLCKQEDKENRTRSWRYGARVTPLQLARGVTANLRLDGALYS